MLNDALKPYNEEMSGYIKKAGNEIVDSYDKLVEQVNRAFDEPNDKATLYFGIIDHSVLEKMENDIPNMPKEIGTSLFKQGKGYSIAATLDSIRHLIDDKKAMTRDDVIDYLVRFADVVINYDSVFFDYYRGGYSPEKGIKLTKRYPDGTIESFDLVSKKRGLIILQTIYMDHASYSKKRLLKPCR